jgi:hypothetical protein
MMALETVKEGSLLRDHPNEPDRSQIESPASGTRTTTELVDSVVRRCARVHLMADVNTGTSEDASHMITHFP